MSGVFGGPEHDIDGLAFIKDGDKIAVNGREWGEMADGTPFPDGRISQGLFCSVYEFEGDLIRAVRIYVDPDFTSSDAAMLKTMRRAGHSWLDRGSFGREDILQPFSASRAPSQQD